MFQKQSYKQECGRAGNYRLDTYRSKQHLEEKKKTIRIKQQQQTLHRDKTSKLILLI